MQILKICDYCTKEFIAKKTTTKCCSDDCAKRFYKLNKRNDKIAQAELKTEIRRQPKAFITEEDIKVIHAKHYLTLKEAALLMNISPLTMRRRALTGLTQGNKFGKKWIFDKHILQLKN